MKNRKPPLLCLGDTLSGWMIGYEDPQKVWNVYNPKLMLTMGREVPVPGLNFWDMWSVIDYRDENVFLVPTLWKDLGHYSHLWKLDEIMHWYFEVPSDVIPCIALLGKGIWRSVDDLAGLHPILQRRLPNWAAKTLTNILASAIAGKGSANCGILTAVSQEIKSRKYRVRVNPFPSDSLRYPLQRIQFPLPVSQN